MEKLLVERVAFFSTARGHENVTSDELMNNFTVGGHTAKSNIDVALELYGHLGDGETPKHYFSKKCNQIKADQKTFLLDTSYLTESVSPVVCPS